MASLKQDTKAEIIAQSLAEIQFARTYKQKKTGNWKINEDLYYGRKQTTDSSSANVDLGLMGAFVHTLLSKIANPLTFKFTKRKESQAKRVKQLNALRQVDQQEGEWDMLDLVGKKQAGIYGRAIYSYFADSEEGYESHLDLVDVYDFLIDPSSKGTDIESARFMGRYGIVLSKQQLEKGLKDGSYDKEPTQELIEGAGNVTTKTTEVTNAANRASATGVLHTGKSITNPGLHKFWEWYTTYEDVRYYLLMNENGKAIVCVPLTDKFESGLYPFWTWAFFPDATEFWTPSPCDYVREIFLAQAVSINQMLDNSEKINKPQKAVNVSAIENLAELKYKKDGYIRVKKDFDANKAIQILQTSPINGPIDVYGLLETIQEKASGVTSASKGVASEDAVGIFKGNEAQTADRFELLNKCYAYGYKRFAMLYEAGVREHLIKRTAIEILGPEGLEIEMVSKRDIFRKGDDFGVMIEASTAEKSLSELDKETKLTFLKEQSLLPAPIQNQKKAYELQAQIAGFTEEEIRQLQDTSEYADSDIMSEAERDIEAILDGNILPPNQGATVAYKQRFADYLMDHQEDISMDQFNALTSYVDSLNAIITRNMTKNANDLLFKAQMEKVKQSILNPQPVTPTAINPASSPMMPPTNPMTPNA